MDFDLILMDWMMHPIDGGTATREIRQGARNCATPVIAVTATEDRETCFAAGLDDYLEKPLSLATLRVKLDRWSASLEPAVSPKA
jgi:CheY-like chemotaxis protein